MDELKTSTVSFSRPQVGEKDWEHSSWFMLLKWRDSQYQIDLEASPVDSTPPTWHLSVARCRGMFQTLFGGRAGRFNVPDDLLLELSTALQHIAHCEPITWITEDDAVDSLWGKPTRPPQK